jgi:hypothetical protein
MQMQDPAQKLIEAARSNPPSDTVPYAFEQRIMAHIRTLKPMDAWAVWSAGLWRAALACLAVTVLSTAWSIWGQRDSTAAEFALEFESAVAVSETDFDDLW